MIDISKLSKNAVTVSAMPNSRYTQTTIEEARKKVADKLEKNWLHILGKHTEKVDKVYCEQNGTYTLGVKYGNRWLKNVFGKDMNFISGITHDELEEAIDELQNCVLAGDLDDSIKAVMQANKVAKQQA